MCCISIVWLGIVCPRDKYEEEAEEERSFCMWRFEEGCLFVRQPRDVGWCVKEGEG